MTKKRYYENVDVLRGFAIFLVVLGHAVAKENIVTIYKSQQDYIDGNYVENVSLNTVGLKQNIKEYIDEVYIDKETGLVIRTHFGNIISEREYEFGNVQDEMFIEPDLKEYEVIKK